MKKRKRRLRARPPQTQAPCRVGNTPAEDEAKAEGSVQARSWKEEREKRQQRLHKVRKLRSRLYKGRDNRRGNMACFETSSMRECRIDNSFSGKCHWSLGGARQPGSEVPQTLSAPGMREPKRRQLQPGSEVPQSLSVPGMGEPKRR